MAIALDALEQLTERIIGCAMAVHSEMGPGLLESVHRECLAIELHDNGLKAQRERDVPLVYRGRTLGAALRIDLLVEDTVIIELKAVERYHPVHLAQVITYLKLTGRPAGLLFNFNVTALRTGLKRASHPDVYRLKKQGRKETNI